MYRVAHPFLNDRHLSFVADDAGYLLPFGSPTVFPRSQERVIISQTSLIKKFISKTEMMLISWLFMFYSDLSFILSILYRHF